MGQHRKAIFSDNPATDLAARIIEGTARAAALGLGLAFLAGQALRALGVV